MGYIEKTNKTKETKLKLKNNINDLGSDITSSTSFRDYVDKITNIYNALPKVIGAGTEVTLENTKVGKMVIQPKGNTAQNGTPTPTNEIPIKNVTGDNDIVIRGKNLFNKNNTTNILNAYLPANTSNSQLKSYIVPPTPKTLIIKLIEGKTYTIQKMASARFRFGFTTTNNPTLDTDNVITSRLANADTGTSVTFTMPVGSPYFVCNFFSPDQTLDAQNGYDNIVNSIQIEEGSIATSYEPYIIPIEKELNLGNLELCKIGDYQDVIFKNESSNENYDNTLVENAWYKKNTIGKVILNGSEDWKYPTSGTNYTFFQLSQNNFPTNTFKQFTNTSDIIYSNKFVNISGKDSILKENQGIAIQNEWFRISIPSTIATTASNFKTWLSNNSVTAYYILDTFITTQITEATLINQLEELNKTIIPGGTIIIKTESNDSNAQLIIKTSALKN